jgi:hypothetical protein
MKPLLLILAVAFGLIMTGSSGQAGLGWTLAECKAHYGEPLGPLTKAEGGRVEYDFASQQYQISVLLLNDKVSRIVYTLTSGFDIARVNPFLLSNAPGATWSNPSKADADNSYRWYGLMNEKKAFYAGLMRGTSLIIWTQEDSDAVRSAQKVQAQTM